MNWLAVVFLNKVIKMKKFFISPLPPAKLTVQFSSVYYLSSNTGTSLKIKNEIQIHLYE